MDAFFRFIAGPVGRLIRVVAGLILIAVGLLWIHGVVGWLVVGLLSAGRRPALSTAAGEAA
jgi:type IV secretory pathway VirB2 component (pilin)